ncbi:hypothetical protein AYK26_07025 [Euryarchaeota archaeon SM23-78]|nr:MAG: hypothetical protein AYK26_07025 [Euryarchaeota archaeon SM23-78]
MLYSEHITFPYGQTENTATRLHFRVNRGVINFVWIIFPPGCAGLVKVRLYQEGHPFLPSQKDEFIRGDAYTFKIPVMYEVKGAPEQMTIEGWNEDDTYDHSIDFMFLVLPKWVTWPAYALSTMFERLIALFK